MVRCPNCGIRLQQATLVCPRHGVPPIALASPETIPVPPPHLFAYRFDRLIGRGGFGAVFLAERLSDGEPVAVKIACGDQPRVANARLAVEGSALRAVGPPTVPRLFENGTGADGVRYLVMEYVPAPTLAEHLARSAGPLPAVVTASLTRALVRALAHVHGAGFLHCDLKPENVFVVPVGSDGELDVRLFDFGLARRLDGAAADDDERDDPIHGAGTPEYMSPEQCTRQRALDPRSDVYALGACLYEMLAGAPPFWGNPAEVLQSHIARRPPRLPRVLAISPHLEEIVLRALAKDPARRFATAADLGAELERALLPAEKGNEHRSTVESASDAGAAANNGQPASNAGGARTGGTSRSRSSVVIVFFEIAPHAPNLAPVLATIGGQLAHVSGDQRAVVFSREAGDNPARTGTQAARALVERGFCHRALVDLSTIAIQARPDGARRYQSTVFKREEQYPRATDPAGVLLSPAVAEVLPDLTGEPVPGDRPMFRLVAADTEVDPTSTRANFAPLVGRENLLQELLDGARWATAAAEPTIATVVGDPGHGKSHLSAELAQRLRSLGQRVEVIFIRAQEVFGRLGEGTTQELLRRLLGPLATSAAASDDLRRRQLAELVGTSVAKELWPGIAVAAGWASPDHTDIRAIAAAPGALRSAAARALGELLRARSRHGPVALILDDAQLADETVLDALEFATLREAACRLWICALARPLLRQRRPTWGARATRRQDLPLAPLDAEAAAELARRLLLPTTNVPPTVLAKLTARTEGVPLLLIELVRGLKRDGLLRRSEKTDLWFLATEAFENLPALPLVEWLASSETEALPADLLGHARLASVLGSEFAPEELEGVMRVLEREGAALESQLDANVGLDRLVTSGLLVRHRQRLVGFRHVLLRDAIYRTLAAERGGQIHRAAHDYYLAAAGMRDEERLPRVALHAQRCGLKEESAAIYLDLARRAERRHHYLEAEILYGNAVDNLSDGQLRAQVEAAQGRGLMRFRVGRLDDALKDLARAYAWARAAGDKIKEMELLLDQSMVLDWASDYGRSAETTEQAASLYDLELSTGGRSALFEARLAYAKGRALHRRERDAQAAPLFERSVSLTADLGPDAYETLMQASNLLGWSYAMTSRYDDAERTFRHNIALCEAAGDMFNLTVVLQNRGILSLLTKRVDRMLDDYRRMIDIARENGFGLAEMAAQKDIGEVYLMVGKLAKAEPEVRRAIEVGRAVAGARSRWALASTLLLARLLVFQDRLSEASALAREIRQRQAEARSEGLTECDFGPGDALMHRMVELACDGAPQGGDADPDAGWRVLLEDAAKITQQPQDTVEMLEIWGLTALRAGRKSDAVSRLREALELSERSADVVAARVRDSLARAEGS
jgi:serine/threonine protein kinase/predicted ATPase